MNINNIQPDGPAVVIEGQATGEQPAENNAELKDRLAALLTSLDEGYGQMMAILADLFDNDPRSTTAEQQQLSMASIWAGLAVAELRKLLKSVP